MQMRSVDLHSTDMLMKTVLYWSQDLNLPLSAIFDGHKDYLGGDDSATATLAQMNAVRPFCIDINGDDPSSTEFSAFSIADEHVFSASKSNGEPS